MQPPSDPALPWLEKVVSEKNVVSKLRPIVSRVHGQLELSKNEAMTWKSVSPSFFGNDLPCQIASIWIFVIRAGVYLGVERHPNSHQRTVALHGAGLFEIYENGVWNSHPISSLGENRSVSIPQKTWHRVTIGSEDLTVISFHTVPASELIEEKPVNEEDLTVTHSRRYEEG
jgi:hypothetical protein